MQMTRRRVVRVAVPMLAGFAVAWVCVAVAAHAQPENAMGAWLVCAAAIIGPALWAHAETERWGDDGKGAEDPVEPAQGRATQEWPLAGDMTINDLVRLSGQIANSKGWHDHSEHPTVTSDGAFAQIAALTPIVLALGEVVEAVRKHPGDSPEVATALANLRRVTKEITMPERHLQYFAADHAERVAEYGKPMAGSKTEALGHILMQVSEAAEEAQGVIAGDLPNTLEEMADQFIRPAARLWAWAYAAAPTWANVPHPPVLADFEVEVRQKLLRNARRPTRHASPDAPNGKRA